MVAVQTNCSTFRHWVLFGLGLTACTDTHKRCTGGPNSVLSPGSCLILAAKPSGDTSPCSKSNLTWTRKHSGKRARDLDEPLKSDLFNAHCKGWIAGHKSVISRPRIRPFFICYSKFSIKLLAAILTILFVSFIQFRLILALQ